MTCLMYVITIRVIHGGQETKQQFAVYDSDRPVTLKQIQGHQRWCELVDLKQSL